MGLQGVARSGRRLDLTLRFGAFAPQGWKLEYSGWNAGDAWARTVEVSRLAEDLGYDHLWVYDHVETVPRREPTHVFEAFTTLAALAQHTQQIRLGQLVTCSSYRNAGLLAKEAAGVDVVSGGRLILGLGAGWYEKDYTTYGYDFGTFGSRFDLFDESLIRIESRLAELIPPPVRNLPILIGGTGPKRSLPAVARHADIWHAFQDLDAFRKSSDRVDELAATFGRNGADIERSTLWENADSADAFREAGVTLFQTELTADDGYDLTSLKQVLTWRDNG